MHLHLHLLVDKSGKSNLRLRPAKACRPAVCDARWPSHP